MKTSRKYEVSASARQQPPQPRLETRPRPDTAAPPVTRYTPAAAAAVPGDVCWGSGVWQGICGIFKDSLRPLRKLTAVPSVCS